MKRLKVMIGMDDSGEILIADALRDETGTWLVPHWIENLTEGWRAPTRMIRLPAEALQPCPGFPCDAQLTTPMSRRALNGQSQRPEAVAYEVVEAPSIRLPMPRKDVH